MKRIFTVCAIINIAALAFAASEEVEMYSYLYDSVTSNTEQLDILQSMQEAKVSGAGEFYAKALRRLVSEYSNIPNATQRSAADEQAILLAAAIGDEKYAAAAPDLWLVVDRFADPLVRAEALVALGKVQAAAFLPQVISVLNRLNLAPVQDRLNGEREAFGAIIALEKYADPAGYLPVYFASTGWYSERIKSQAIKSLAVISSDPEPFMSEIVKGSGYDYRTKFAALQTIESSSASNDKKTLVAGAALVEAWRVSTSDVNMRNVLRQMRKLSMDMLSRYGTQDSAVYPALERCYTSGLDINEKLDAIKTLTDLATDDSAQLLNKFLIELNAKNRAGTVKREEQDLVRAIIPALGTVKKPVSIPALNMVRNSGWATAVITLADNALKQIQGN
jgi:hypothetical protein